MSITYALLKKKYGKFGKMVPIQEKAMMRRNDGTFVATKDSNTDKTVYCDARRTISNPISLTKVFPGVGKIYIPIRQTLPNTHTS